MAFINKFFHNKSNTEVAQPIKRDEKSQEVIMNLIESGVLDRESKVSHQQCEKMEDPKSELHLKFYTFVLVWLMVVLGLMGFSAAIVGTHAMATNGGGLEIPQIEARDASTDSTTFSATLATDSVCSLNSTISYMTPSSGFPTGTQTSSDTTTTGGIAVTPIMSEQSGTSGLSTTGATETEASTTTLQVTSFSSISGTAMSTSDAACDATQTVTVTMTVTTISDNDALTGSESTTTGDSTEMTTFTTTDILSSILTETFTTSYHTRTTTEYITSGFLTTTVTIDSSSTSTGMITGTGTGNDNGNPVHITGTGTAGSGSIVTSTVNSTFTYSLPTVSPITVGSSASSLRGRRLSLFTSPFPLLTTIRNRAVGSGGAGAAAEGTASTVTGSGSRGGSSDVQRGGNTGGFYCLVMVVAACVSVILMA